MRSLALGCLLAWLCACSSNGKGTGNDGGGDGSTSNGDAAGSCTAPLSESTVCAPTFEMQVSNNPCDPDMATQATCGKYRIWTLIVVGSDTCVYDTTANGNLVGARSCGGAPAECTDGCTTFGIAASQYATCGAETAACPP